MSNKNNLNEIGIVVIGRNEGNKLKSCLGAVVNNDYPIVYVDSASSDNSIEIARQFQIEVIELDIHEKLTSARGRNEGAKHLLKLNPNIEYIQFIDGDTTLSSEWLQLGMGIFKERPDVGIVTGELKEKNSVSSIYKQLAALEWESTPGEIDYCGGNFMVRTTVFRDVGGFNSMLKSGEDTDFCLRVRQNGWKIIQAEGMLGIHDTSVTNFASFWKRAMRTGYCFQEISGLHGNSAEKLFVRENRSTWIFGGLIPIVVFAFFSLTDGWSLLLLIAYPALAIKIYYNSKSHWSRKQSALYSAFCVISKFPGFLGACQYLLKSFFSILK